MSKSLAGPSHRNMASSAQTQAWHLGLTASSTHQGLSVPISTQPITSCRGPRQRRWLTVDLGPQTWAAPHLRLLLSSVAQR